MDTPTYLHLKPGAAPPCLEGAAFKAVLISEVEASSEWMGQISDWLVRSGCRYLMAWGVQCGDWHDDVDVTNLMRFDFGDVPDDDHIMTTWHEDEPLKEVFWFCEHVAAHMTVELSRTYLMHVSETERSADVLRAFVEAQSEY